MAGTTNLQQWNPTAVNQESDAQYTADSQRSGGATDPSVFLSPLANKLFYQMSTYLTALFQAFAAKGFTTSDSNLNTLTATCANFLTSADVKPLQVLVPFSPAPQFDCSLASSFRINLAGNVTSSTLINPPPAGGIVTFYIVSTNPGNFSFAWPSQVNGAFDVLTQSSGNLYTQQFISDGANLFPVETFLSTLLALLDSFEAAQAAENAALNGGINNAQNSANAAQGAANNAQNSANAAQGTANTAQGSANTALAQIAALQLSDNMQDVTGARGFGATYTNTSGGVMYVTGYGTTVGSDVGSVACFVNGDVVFANTVGATVDGGACGFSFVVYNGGSYQIQANTLTGGRNGVNGLGKWIESVVTI